MRWSSRGNVLKRVFELKEELKEFLGTQKHAKCQQWLNLLEDPVWKARLCYLSDIFEKLNKHNLSLQGKDSNIIDFTDNLSGFQGFPRSLDQKVNIWRTDDVLEIGRVDRGFGG